MANGWLVLANADYQVLQGICQLRKIALTMQTFD